jgi:TIR domain-containing protein
MRKVFLSHANPEDNEFVLWLAGRLAGAGYEIWSDVTKLIGGELFWERIETAIRSDTAIFVSVVSKPAIKKRGFLNELSVACSVEAQINRDDFVVPLRLDDLSFADFPAQLHRKNAIDFQKGWHAGLVHLLRKLTQSNVPSREDASGDIETWTENYFGFARGVRQVPESASTNWLEVLHIPRSLFVTKAFRVANMGDLFKPQVWPLVKFRDQIISFARPETLGLDGGIFASKPTEVSLDAVIMGDARFLLGAPPTAGRGIVASLLRRCWERLAQSMGLVHYRLSGRSSAWFPPLSGEGIQWIEYLAMDGQRRKKRLIGRSEKRQVYWHAALQVVPMFDPKLHLALVMHVVFSSDGVSPLGDAALMHRLRRRFCKNWWQGQWRDLQMAFLAFIAKDSGVIQLPCSVDRTIDIARAGKTVMIPASFDESQVKFQGIPSLDELSQDDDLEGDALSDVDFSDTEDLFEPGQTDSKVE